MYCEEPESAVDLVDYPDDFDGFIEYCDCLVDPVADDR